MTTRIASTNIQNATIELSNMSAAAIAALSSTTPTITQIQITNSSYVVLDDTAVSTSGGYIKITGTNFTAGSQVVIGNVTATSVGFVNSTTLNVQVPAQAAGTYIVYLTTNTGSVAILVNGLTYSGAPTWVTGSTLDNGNQGSPLSIQLTATGDAPLTYALAAGSSLPPGLTLSSGGLISGTVTGLSVQTLYNFTVNAIDAEAQDSPRAFTITILVNDPQFPYVSLLLSASNPSSTFVTDASTNNFAVSVVGDTRPNDFSSLTPGYYNNFFSGSNYWTLPANTNYNYGSGDFTIEFWIYPIATSTAATETYMPVVGAAGSFSPGNSNWVFLYAVTGGNRLTFSTQESGTSYGVSSNSFTPTFNVWQHWAVVRSSGTITFYVNGVGIGGGSFTRNQNFGSLGIAVASMWGGGTPFTVNWVPSFYLSNLRFVVGTAVYTSNFTPSTTPLTAITNTQLLACQSNRFKDESTNNAAFTFTGTTTITGFNPFVPNSNYSTYGSGYFDGTGDYLSVPDNEAFNFTGDFTIECWLYPTSHPTAVYLIGQSSSTDYAPVLLYLSNGRPGIGASSTGSTWTINSFVGTALTLNTWSHVAMVRSGNKWSIYVNGVENVIAASTAVTPYNSTDPLGIGGEAAGSLTYPYVGYMTNVRIVKGTAVYTTNFTPPSTPLTAIANTSLLTLQNNQPTNNSMFIDNSTNNFLITRNGNTTQGSFTPYVGTWSNYFDGSGDYLSVSSNAAFALPGNFTVEAWVYIAANSNADGSGFRTATIVSTKQSGPTDGFEFQISGNGSTTGTGLSAEIRVGGNNLGYGVTATIPQTTWNHIAFVRSGTTLTYYLNGTSLGSSTVSQNIPAGTLTIGGQTVSGYTRNLNGYISNLRIVKGTAVYTGNFTPATSPLIPIVNTSILTCTDNRFIDDSMNNFAITKVGDVIVQRFSPFSPQLQQIPTSYSVYFDGTGDWLSGIGTASSFNFMHNTSALFTIEAWVYTGTTGAQQTIACTNGFAASASVGFWFTIETDNTLRLFVTKGSAGNPVINTVSSGTVPLNSWTHVAVTYNQSLASNNATFYVNGVLSGTGTKTANAPVDSNAANALNVGSFQGGGAYMVGYISNLRITNSIVYTGAFTPSTTPLTAIANTALLTCQSTTIIDNSTNNFTITVNGNSQPLPQNPFGYSNPAPGPYVPATYGGSVYFDGTGDYLTIPDNAAFEMSGDFTVECWFYATSAAANYSAIVSKAATGIYSPYTIYLRSSLAVEFWSSTNGSSWNLASGVSFGTVTLGTWNHVAVSRQGANCRLFLNGVLATTISNSSALTDNGNAVGIGGRSDGTELYTGFIGDVRIAKGVASYTTPFVPNNAPLTAIPNTSVLCNMNSAGVYDSSMNSDFETVGNTSISTSVKKYGNSSIYFDGTGDYLITPASQNFVFGTGDFTIECWLYLTALGADDGVIIELRSSGVTGNGFVFNVRSSGGGYVLNFYTDSAPNVGSTVLSLNTWNHVAVTRSGSTVRLFSNGAVSATITKSNNFSNTPNPTIGQSLLYSNSNLTGYMDDLRITKGFARYTTTFTPPTSPFLAY